MPTNNSINSPKFFTGNPNGNVAGNLGNFCINTSAGNTIYYCTTAGTSSTAVWTLIATGTPSQTVGSILKAVKYAQQWNVDSWIFTYNNGSSGVGATVTNAGTQVAFTIDGVTPSIGDRILFQHDASGDGGIAGGIYTVTNLGSGSTNWVLTRATDYNQGSLINPGDIVFVTDGNTNANTYFINNDFANNYPTVIGTTGIGFDNLLLAGNTFVEIKNQTLQQLAIQNLTGTIGANGSLLVANNANVQGVGWTTATYPTSTTINRILYSSANNTVGQITTLNSGVLVTSAGGVPSISTTLPSGLTIPGYQTSLTLPLSLANGGTNASLTASNGGIVWSNATQLQILGGTATARQMLQSGASGTPAWSTTTWPATTAISTLLYSSAANVISALTTGNNGVLITSGTGVPSISSTLPSGLTIPLPLISGVINAGNAAAGNVGEVISSTIAGASAVSLTNSTPANVTSISLTAGDWDVFGMVSVLASGANLTTAEMWTSTTSATRPDQSLYSGVSGATSTLLAYHVPYARYNVSSTTTVFLSVQANFATGTATGCGSIFARRAR